ncbi:MAG: cytochrome c [Myxococcota bacterium]
MKRACWAWIVVAACRTAQPEGNPQDGEAIVSDVGRSKEQLSCNHCHATRVEVTAGLISPAPPWPGTLRRPHFKGDPSLTDPLEASARCAERYQDRPLTAREQVALRTFLEREGPALPGQPAVYDVRPYTVAEIRAVVDQPGDGGRGKELWERACTRCHSDGPGYGKDVISSSARGEIAARIMQGPGPGQKGMPAFVRSQLSVDDIADLLQHLEEGF